MTSRTIFPEVLWSALFAAILILAGCAREEMPPSVETQQPIAVTTVVVQPERMQRSFYTHGLVIPAEEFEISADVAALVKQVKFDEGQQIAVGDELIVLDDAKFRLQLQTATARLDSAKAGLEEARANHEKNASVFEKGAISRQMFQQSKSRLDSSVANVEAARAERLLAAKDLEATRIVSPVSGVVTERSIDPGKNITPQLTVGKISGSNLFWVETYVAQKDINLLYGGMQCSVAVDGVSGSASSLTGSIDIIATRANQNTGNYRVRVAVSDPLNRLRDGMMARVTFNQIFEDDVIALPREAVQDYHREFVVYKYSDGVAERLSPTLAIGGEDSFVVVDGIKPGDEIIVGNANAVTEGSLVSKRS